MASQQELKYQITADDSKFKATMSNVEKILAKSGGSSTLSGIASGATKEWGSLDSMIGKVTGTIGSIPIPAAAAASAIAGIGAAVYGVGAELFDLAKQASDFGRTIAGMESKTGLSAVAVSTLGHAAVLSGKELSDMQRPLVAFNELLVKTQEGGKGSSAVLNRLGVTDLKNIDIALDQASKGLAKMSDGQDKLHTSVELFGKRGGPDMINILKKMPGGFLEAQKEAEKLGFTLSETDVKAAADFGKAYRTIGLQVEVASAKFALQYAPQITGALKDISGWISSNKDTWAEWGSYVSKVVGGAINGLTSIVKFFNDHPWLTRSIAAVVTLGGSEAAIGSMTALANGATPGAGAATTNGGWLEKYIKPARETSFDYSKDADTGGKSKGIRAPKESDSQFREFFKDLGFNVVRTFGDAINKNSPHAYGGAADVSVRGKSATDIFTLMVKSLEHGYRVFDERLPQPGVKQTGPHVHVENAKTSLTKASAFENVGFSAEQIAYLKHLDAERLGKASGASGFESFVKKQTDEQIQSAEKVADRRVEIGQTMTEELIAQAERYNQMATEQNDPDAVMASLQRVHDLKMQFIDDEITAAQNAYDAAEIGSEKEAEAFHKLELLQLQRNGKARQLDDDLAKSRKASLQRNIDDAVGLFEKGLTDFDTWAQQLEAASANERHDLGSAKANAARDWGVANNAAKGQGPQSAGAMLGQGNEKFTDNADAMKATFSSIRDIGVGTFNDIAGAMGSVIENWVLYGSASEGSAKKAIAASLAMAASQSFVSMIMETAYGIAALTPWGAAIYGSPWLHFKSAAMFGLIAAGTGGLGRGLAGGSQSKGGGSATGKAESNSVGTSGTGYSESQTPSSRTSQTAYYSGHNDTANSIQQLNETVARLDAKIGSMSPGEVLTLGARSKRGFITETMVDEVRANSGHANKLNRALGNR